MVFVPPQHRNPDTPRGGSASILSKAIKLTVAILQANGLDWKPGKELRDNFGRYFVSGDAGDLKFGVCAKKYILVNIVGTGEDVVELCIRENRYLLMYISDINKIYLFDATECKREGTTSTRQGLKPFYDWNIRLGTNFVGWLHERCGLVGTSC